MNQKKIKQERKNFLKETKKNSFKFKGEFRRYKKDLNNKKQEKVIYHPIYNKKGVCLSIQKN